MWHSNMENNFFISNLYYKVPKLINIKIEKIELFDGGRNLKLCFDLPYYAEIPPEKWVSLGYNTVFVELDFFDISEYEIKSTKNMNNCDIDIKKVEDGFIISIKGSVMAEIKADYSYIQRVSGYINESNSK